MKATKLAALREKSEGELQEMLVAAQAEFYTARKDLVFRKQLDTTGMKVRRHNIARILTVMTEKKKGAAV